MPSSPYLLFTLINDCVKHPRSSCLADYRDAEDRPALSPSLAAIQPALHRCLTLCSSCRLIDRLTVIVLKFLNVVWISADILSLNAVTRVFAVMYFMHFYRTMLHRARYCHSKLFVSPSVYLSITSRYRDLIGWNSSKLISRLISLGVRCLQTPNITDLLQRHTCSGSLFVTCWT